MSVVPTDRQRLVNRMVLAHGYNPRDWREEATIRRCAADLVAQLTDEQVREQLRTLR